MDGFGPFKYHRHDYLDDLYIEYNAGPSAGINKIPQRPLLRLISKKKRPFIDILTHIGKSISASQN